MTVDRLPEWYRHFPSDAGFIRGVMIASAVCAALSLYSHDVEFSLVYLGFAAALVLVALGVWVNERGVRKLLREGVLTVGIVREVRFTPKRGTYVIVVFHADGVEHRATEVVHWPEVPFEIGQNLPVLHLPEAPRRNLVVLSRPPH
jgi:hypothetical protein